MKKKKNAPHLNRRSVKPEQTPAVVHNYSTAKNAAACRGSVVFAAPGGRQRRE
jgi:hypothetical protein